MIVAAGVGVSVDGAVLLPPTSLRLQAGRTAVVRGRNGTGKSTLLRVLAGLLKPSTGSIEVAGMVPRSTRKEFRAAVAGMIGTIPLAPDLTMREHLLMVARTWSEDPATAAGGTAAALEALDLGALADRFPHELSSGQVQLFSLALTTLRPCRLLLLDEPEQRLDDEHLEMVCDLLAARRDAGASLVIATHSPVLAERLADQVLEPGAAA